MRVPRLYKTPMPALALSVLFAFPLSLAQAPTGNSGTSTPAKPVASQLRLYLALFGFVADMERDRVANPPTQLANMVEIEDHLRKKIHLSAGEWKTLAATSVKVTAYARESSKQARAFADRDRASRRDNPLSANSLAAGRETLHKMQLDLNARAGEDIKEMEAAMGTDATANIHVYLNGPLAASAHVMPRPVHKKVAP